MKDVILEVVDLKKYFPTKRGTVKAVDGVSFTVQAGETLGLVGESGSGKTTTAHCIIGLYPPTGGELRFKGQDISRGFERRPLSLRREIRIVFQDPGSSLNPKRNVAQILSVPLKVHRIVGRSERLSKVRELLEMVELPPDDYLYKTPRALGGGEMQMVAIARALATSPSLVVLDEPTSALDVSVQAKIISLLLRLQLDLGLTYLFITHDLSLMRNVASRVAIMYLGKLAEIAPTLKFFRSPLHPYTKMLLSSVPVVSPEERALKPEKVVSRGEIPSPVNVPPGCSFHLRCPEKGETCSQLDPTLQEIEENHFVRCLKFQGPP
ncbi:ABC transporter ATP-binding protein [Candidatus Bipolaricaulota bacterium]|nr:ABC transporter ATP-binding protein [Candidatus Bipolaricaulota bacterium]